MPRNIVKRDQEQSSSKPLDTPPIVGGATGEPTDPNPPSAHIYGLNDVAPAREEAEHEEIPQKSYRVVGGPDSVVYDGQRVRVLRGNVYRENCTDIALLKRQGVQLEEIVEEKVA